MSASSGNLGYGHNRALGAELSRLRRERVTLALLQLELALFGRPKRLEIRDHGANLLRRHFCAEGGHREPLWLVEWITPTLVHHLVQLGIRMSPRLPFRIVRLGR